MKSQGFLRQSEAGSVTELSFSSNFSKFKLFSNLKTYVCAYNHTLDLFCPTSSLLGFAIIPVEHKVLNQMKCRQIYETEYV